MKRADIEIGPVYGFSEDRARIYHYSPVIVLSLDSYTRARYGNRALKPADQPRERLNRGGWRTHTAPVGLLSVMLYHTDHDSLRRVRALATVEAAVRALDENVNSLLDITDGTDAQTGQPVVLGRYILVTSAGDFHGLYSELTAALEAADRQRQEYATEAEQARVANVETYRALAERLDKLGVTGYHCADWESPTRFDRLTFEDMDALVCLAEQGALRQQFR